MTVLAIVVTYNPDPARLAALLDSLAGQVDGTVLVDNGSRADIASFVAARRRDDEHVVALGANLGIAAAHNRGIAFARERGARYIILFDHDSRAEPDMIRTLVTAVEGRARKGETVAAVGPNLLDARLGRGTHFENRKDIAPDGLVPVDHLISSGCLIPMAALDRVGPMREELFIDYVDIEWCLRAAAAGLRCYGAVSARMAHEFGEPVNVLGRPMAAHGPMRQYYLFRNSIWLLRQGWIPTRWRIRSGTRIVLRLGFNALFARPRRDQWRMMWRGVRHGVQGRTGPGHDPAQ